MDNHYIYMHVYLKYNKIEYNIIHNIIQCNMIYIYTYLVTYPGVHPKGSFSFKSLPS